MMPSLPIWQFDVLLLVLVVLFAVVALSIRNLMGAAVVFGAYSFMMCLIWAGMGAVDVAFTEAAVGAGVSTVFVVSTLYNTGATMQRRTGGMAFKLFIGVVVTIAGVFLLSALPDFPKWGAPDSPDTAKVAPYYILNTIEPSGKELNVARAFLSETRKRYQANAKAADKLLAVGMLKLPVGMAKPETAAWTVLGQALLNLSETITRN